MNFRDLQAQRKLVSLWEVDVESIEQIRVDSQQQIEQKFGDATALYESKVRLIKFIGELRDLKKTQIRQDVIYHCQHLPKSKKLIGNYISEDSILKLVNLRIQKMIKNKKIKKNWSQEDVKILVWVISKYVQKNEIIDIDKELDFSDWENIASLIPGVTPNCCMFKWLSLKKVNLSSQNWGTEESHLLQTIIKDFITSEDQNYRDIKGWKTISQELYRNNRQQGKVFRSAKQCREHWNCFLNPQLKKGPWNIAEDILLLKSIKQNKGDKKWSQIVKRFYGRTENALKNRYNLLIEKQKKISKTKQQFALLEDCLQKSYVEQYTTMKQKKMVEPYFEQNKQPIKIEEQRQTVSIEQQISVSKQISQDIEKQRPITPLRIQKFSFTNFEELSKSKLQYLQHGVINNGIFQKKEIKIQLVKQFSSRLGTSNI